MESLEQLKDNFSSLPDKQQAWNDLIKLTSDEDRKVRSKVIFFLSFALSQVPDKQQAWSDLHRLLNDENSSVRRGAATVLISLFSQFPDKQQAWEDLHNLLNDEEKFVRLVAITVLRFSFSQLPDKQQAWNDLHTLLNCDDRDLKGYVAGILSSIFVHLPNKHQAWEDLHNLLNEKDSSIRRDVAKCFRLSFPQFPNKQQAWNDLHRLTNDQDSDVREMAAFALGLAFIYIPDKQQAWDDLYRLTNDNHDVRCYAALALYSVFSYVPYKELTFKNLCRLTTDEDWIVRSYANHSLGKISILKASQAQNEDGYRKELERAIEFFEKASEKSFSLSISQFCLPFYRSFYTIIFKKHEAKEVDKYLAEAKDSIKGSKSKELLLEAVNNLANALKEVQNLENMDLKAMKGELNFYRQYCDRAAELMRETEEEAPYAIATMRKGLPILDRNLKKLLEEIQKKAKTACQVSQGTSTQEIACAVNREVQKWEIGSQEEMTQMIENLAYILEEKISVQPKNQYILGKIDQMKSERNLVRQYEILSQIIPMIRNVTVVPDDAVKENYEDLKKSIMGKIDEKFEEISVSLKPGPRAELVISMGLEALGSGTKGVITIPLAEIKYPGINIDLEKVKEGTKLSKLPQRLVDKIKSRLP
jgi:HEAT repeat protein